MDNSLEKNKSVQIKDKFLPKVPSKCSVIVKSLPYWLILLVFFLQISSVVQTHSLVARLTIADTLLILIVHFHKVIALYSCFSTTPPQRGTELSHTTQPFFTVVGCVAFEALLFVNLTHSLEAVFCAEPSSDISPQFLAINCFNILTKLLFLASTSVDISLGGISCLKQLVLHVLAPTVALSLSLMNHHYSSEDNYYMLQLDPLLSIGLCVPLLMIIVPASTRQMSYLLLNNPDGIDLEKFKQEIEEKFVDTKCTHLHMFRHYPGSGFEIFMDISFLTQYEQPDMEGKEKKEMCRFMETRTEMVMRGIRSVLHKAGATRVTIQPYYTNLIKTESGTIGSEIRSMQCETSECSTDKRCCKQVDVISNHKV